MRQRFGSGMFISDNTNVELGPMVIRDVRTEGGRSQKCRRTPCGGKRVFSRDYPYWPEWTTFPGSDARWINQCQKYDGRIEPGSLI